MEDTLILNVVIKGENIMRDPLLSANGLAIIKGKKREVKIETPVTSVSDFVEAFEGLFKE